MGRRGVRRARQGGVIVAGMINVVSGMGRHRCKPFRKLGDIWAIASSRWGYVYVVVVVDCWLVCCRDDTKVEPQPPRELPLTAVRLLTVLSSYFADAVLKALSACFVCLILFVLFLVSFGNFFRRAILFILREN